MFSLEVVSVILAVGKEDLLFKMLFLCRSLTLQTVKMPWVWLFRTPQLDNRCSWTLKGPQKPNFYRQVQAFGRFCAQLCTQSVQKINFWPFDEEFDENFAVNETIQITNAQPDEPATEFNGQRLVFSNASRRLSLCNTQGKCTSLQIVPNFFVFQVLMNEYLIGILGHCNIIVLPLHNSKLSFNLEVEFMADVALYKRNLIIYNFKTLPYLWSQEKGLQLRDDLAGSSQLFCMLFNSSYLSGKRLKIIQRETMCGIIEHAKRGEINLYNLVNKNT